MSFRSPRGSNQTLRSLCSDFADLCSDFADLCSDLADLRSDFIDLCSDFVDLCSDFADLCLDFADFDLRGDYEFLVPTRIYSDLLSLNIKPRPRPGTVSSTIPIVDTSGKYLHLKNIFHCLQIFCLLRS